MSKRNRSGGMTAAELMSQLSTDEEFVRIRSAADATLRDEDARLARAESPIVEDLAAVEIKVSSVWDLVNSATPYGAALPILLQHLKSGGYPDRVMESLGRALAVKPSVEFWDDLVGAYKNSRGPGEREGLAVALAASATSDQIPSIIELVRDASLGDTRAHLLSALMIHGGDEGRSFIRGLRKDPVLGAEVRRLIKD